MIPLPIYSAERSIMTLGERARIARERLGLSQKAIAECVGIGPGTLSDLENGRSGSTTKLSTLAKCLRVNQRWLEFEKGEMELNGIRETATVVEDWPVEVLEFARDLSIVSDSEIRNKIIEAARIFWRGLESIKRASAGANVFK